jgi:hypothetical protein
MYIFTAFFIIGVTLECVSKDWKMWLAAKTLFGCGLGMVQVTMTTVSRTDDVRWQPLTSAVHL